MISCIRSGYVCLTPWKSAKEAGENIPSEYRWATFHKD